MLKLALAILPLIAVCNNQFDQNNEKTQLQDETNVEYPYPDRPEIYRIDGIEYVDRSNRRATLRVVFQEEFF